MGFVGIGGCTYGGYEGAALDHGIGVVVARALGAAVFGHAETRPAPPLAA